MKLPAHPVKTGQGTAGLPGKVISFCIVPLDPAHSAGIAGHVPANTSKLPSSYHNLNLDTTQKIRRKKSETESL
jgi:hypothetical protein